MDVRIKQSPLDVAAMRISQSPQVRRMKKPAVVLEDRLPVELRRFESRGEARLGFGRDTQAPTAAALETLDYSLQGARRIVPRVEEPLDTANFEPVEVRDLAPAEDPAKAAAMPPPEEAASQDAENRAPAFYAGDARPSPTTPQTARLDVSV